MTNDSLVTVMELVTRLDRWFADKLQGLRCQEDTRAYVTGVLAGFRLDGDMSRESVVLAFADARTKGNFVAFKRIGDWALWVEAMNPACIQDNREVVETIGCLSYYTCYRLIKGWRLYEELADCLPTIARQIRQRLHSDALIVL